MVSLSCFANCAHATDGECRLNVMGSDRLAEVECACEYYKERTKNSVIKN